MVSTSRENLWWQKKQVLQHACLNINIQHACLNINILHADCIEVTLDSKEQDQIKNHFHLNIEMACISMHISIMWTVIN